MAGIELHLLAFMRFARYRSRSGEIVSSCFETAYQLGFVRHAAAVVRPLNSVAAAGSCTPMCRLIQINDK
jgi:hypothetical protein